MYLMRPDIAAQYGLVGIYTGASLAGEKAATAGFGSDASLGYKGCFVLDPDDFGQIGLHPRAPPVVEQFCSI